MVQSEFTRIAVILVGCLLHIGNGLRCNCGQMVPAGDPSESEAVRALIEPAIKEICKGQTTCEIRTRTDETWKIAKNQTVKYASLKDKQLKPACMLITFGNYAGAKCTLLRKSLTDQTHVDTETFNATFCEQDLCNGLHGGAATSGPGHVTVRVGNATVVPFANATSAPPAPAKNATTTPKSGAAKTGRDSNLFGILIVILVLAYFS